MSTSLSFGPIPVPYPFPARTRTFQRPFFHRTHFPGLPDSRPLLRTVAKFGFLGSGHLPDPDTSEGVIKELVSRAEGILYTIADAAVSNSDVVSESKQTSGDWLSGITNSMESILKVLKNGLSALHVPYAYGFAIILLTLLVKAATFPLTKKQVESAMAMRSLQPQIKAIQQRYAGDQERIQLETARLYKLAGINPLAGCLPTLATIPVWIGLYRALSNVANEGLLKEGFFWIPSLAGPTTIASRQNGSGISWLFPFVDGHPPLGWSDTAAYLVLPVLLIVSQYISVQIMQSSQPNDPNMKTSQAITKFLPLMIGYFALSVPSGLSLYWFTNNILSTVQQVWLQKLGGAKNPMGQITDDIFKEKPLETPKSVFDTKSTETVEKSPSTGLQQGERFKQLKEEEARRKQKREEEMRRKAEEAADKATHTTKEGHEKQDSLVERGNGATAGVVNGRNEVNMPSTTPDFSSAGPAVNGNASTMASKEQGTSDVSAESSEPTNGTSNEQLEQIRDENSEKGTVEVPDGRAASSENRSSGEETSS